MWEPPRELIHVGEEEGASVLILTVGVGVGVGRQCVVVLRGGMLLHRRWRLHWRRRRQGRRQLVQAPGVPRQQLPDGSVRWRGEREHTGQGAPRMRPASREKRTRMEANMSQGKERHTCSSAATESVHA